MGEDTCQGHKAVSAHHPAHAKLQGLKLTDPADHLCPEDSFGAVYYLPRRLRGLSRKTSQPWSLSHQLKQ